MQVPSGFQRQNPMNGMGKAPEAEKPEIHTESAANKRSSPSQSSLSHPHKKKKLQISLHISRLTVAEAGRARVYHDASLAVWVAPVILITPPRISIKPDNWASERASSTQQQQQRSSSYWPHVHDTATGNRVHTAGPGRPGAMRSINSRHTRTDGRRGAAWIARRQRRSTVAGRSGRRPTRLVHCEDTWNRTIHTLTRLTFTNSTPTIRLSTQQTATFCMHSIIDCASQSGVIARNYGAI